MTNSKQSKAELLQELEQLRQRVSELEHTLTNQQIAKTEQALRESEHRLKTFIDVLPDHAVIMDAQGSYLDIVRRGSDLDWPLPDDVVGKNVYEIFSQEFADFMCSTIYKTLDKNAIQVIEYSRDSLHREARIAPLHDLETGEARVLWVWRDITARKQAEEKLRESEQRYLSLLEQVPVAFMVYEKLDTKLQLAYANPAASAFYKIDDINAFVGMDAMAFSSTISYTEETMRLAKERSETFLAGKNLPAAEYAIQQPDGSISYAIFDSVHITYAGKAALLTIIRDITEQRKAESALQESEKRLRALLNALPDRVVVFDEAGTYQEVLKKHHLPHEPHIEVGDNIFDVNKTHQTVAELCLAKIQETLQKQENLVFEYEFNAGEKIYSFEGRTVPYKDPVTNQPLVIWMTRDISQQRRAEKGLQESEKRLRSLVQALPDRVVVFDAKGTYREVWRTDEIYQSPSKPGQNVYNVFDKEFSDFCLEKIRETLEKQEKITFEYDAFVSGKTRYIWASTVPYQDPFTNQPLVIWITRDISQLREAEKNLRESEARYRALIEQMPALVYRASLNNPHATYYVSPYIQQLLGYSQEEWLNTSDNWSTHIHVDDRERIIAEKGATFPFVGEYRMINRQKQTIWVRDESLIVRDRSGANLVIQGVVFDITQQKIFEKALRESEQSYRAVFNSSTNLLMIHDGKTLLLTNQATADLLAYDEPNDLIGIPLVEIIHPDDRSFVSKIAKLRRQGADVPSRYQMRIVDKHGEVHCVDSHSQTIEFAGYEVTLASAVDITEQKRFEQILRESEANYRAIVHDQTDLICRFTPDYMLTFVNNAYEQYFGESATTLIGKKLWDLLPEDKRAGNKLHLTTILSRLTPDNPVGIEENAEIFVKGETRSIQFTNRALFDYKGNLIAYQSVGRDITERRKTEDELARYRNNLEDLVKVRTADLQHEIAEHEQTQKNLRLSLEKLDAANKELEAFSYTVSHDLRAPLRALNNYSQFLQEDCGAILSENCLQYAEGIAESALQMERLVLDLLDYSRINRVQVPSSDVDIAELLDEIIVRLQLEQEARLILPPKLPTVHAKRIRLEQIFSNLLSNALKFRRRECSLEIAVAFEERTEEWEFSIQDNGIGIAEKYKEQIFGIFQRLHTQEEYEGTGIGLAIVDKAVKEHQGQVRVESEPGKGSKFSFTISKNLD